MKLFRFCRWSLAALPVFFVFTACDQLLPPPAGGTGKLVPVKIRSVSVKGYGEVSATRSAGGEKRIMGQPIIQDLGGGMLAEITVEEDVSALRAGDKSLDDKVQFRVIAVDSNNKVYSYADYESNKQKQSYDLINNTNLHVLKDVDYDYIFISYNNSILPPAPEEGDDLSNVTIAVTAGSNDLLWQTISNPQTDSDGVPVLKFDDIKHKLARVTLKLNAGAGKTITNIANNSISLDAGSSGSFNLTNGTFVSSTGSVNFSGWTGYNSTEVTSGTSTFLTKAAGGYTLSLADGAVKLSDDKLSKMSSATLPNTTFETGKSYTIRITRPPRFAGSNIYWDSANSRLTFDDYGTTANTKYQGVYFKWGSLIGVAAGANDETFSSGTTTNKGQNDGTPIYMKDPDGKWVKTNVAYATQQKWFGSGAVDDNTTDSEAWDLIPHYDTSMNELETLPSGFANYKGDICIYINSAYRMPTKAELDALGNPTDGTYKWTVDDGSDTSSDATGQRKLRQYGTFTGIPGSTYYLPASGYRYPTSGTLYHAGSNGYYWSGSAYSNQEYAYELRFSSVDAYTSATLRRNGQPVRCVLIE